MKTLAIRLEDDQHARLSILAKLAGESLTDVIRTALDAHIEKLAADTDISAKAKSALDEIEREASEQKAAIASLFGNGDDATASPVATTGSSRSSSRTKTT